MADTKISALTALAGASIDTALDEIPIVDASAGETKATTVDDLAIALDAEGTLASASDLTTHEADTTSVHGISDTANVLLKTLADAKGDLLVATAADTIARLAVGATNGMVLEAQSGQSAGVQWVAPTHVVSIQVTDPNGDALTTGNGKAYFRVPSTINGANLIAVAAAITTASSSGTPTIQIHNVTQAADMLSTAITIDATPDLDSKDATTPAVIDGANDDVATGDQLRIDVDVAGTGAKGLIVELQFRLP
jgi:hypothetical protein